MRASFAAAAIAGAAVVHAHNGTSTIFDQFDDCTTSTESSGGVATATITETYCHECEESSSTWLTTYTTAYSEFCSSGSAPFTEKSYTITESCATPGVSHPPEYLPTGFTVTTAICHVCAETPVTGTITTPVPTHITTYTTAFTEFCSSCEKPFTEKTYTVSEPCPTPGVPLPSGHVPSGFVVTTATCHVCAETPVTATITTPVPTHITTYTTAFTEFCSSCETPFTEKTYTVSEPCPTPGVPLPSGHIPSGFEVTTATCHVCASTPIVATLTAPAANTPPAPTAPIPGAPNAPYASPPAGTGAPLGGHSVSSTPPIEFANPNAASFTSASVVLCIAPLFIGALALAL